jgi:hypothetical protein
MNYVCLACGQEAYEWPCTWKRVTLEIDDDPRSTGRLCHIEFCNKCESALERLIKKLKFKHLITSE